MAYLIVFIIGCLLGIFFVIANIFLEADKQSEEIKRKRQIKNK